MTGWLDWLRPRDGQESASVVNEDAFEALRRSIAAEFSTYRSFHVVGPARSGTTALIAALGLATNARTFSEPLPRIGRRVRQWRLGEAVDPVAVIWGNRIGRMREVIGEGRIYGEKDQQVYCWLPHFFELFKSRFVLSHRDGRESVPSLWDLHYKIHGNLYREVEDASRLSPQASERASRLPLVAQDEVDAMRSRPTADEPVFVPWGSMTRFEMISWYWADYLLVAQRDLYKLPGSAWRTVRFGGSESLDWIQELFGFLELEGFEEDVVGGLLASKPGSFTEQSTNEQARHEHWSDWDAEKTEQFDRYAARAMVQFGYYGIDRLPPVGGANPDPRAPLMVPPDDVQRQIWGESVAAPGGLGIAV